MQASAVPIVPDSEGTYSNPFLLDASAVFMFRVLQRVNHLTQFQSLALFCPPWKQVIFRVSFFEATFSFGSVMGNLDKDSSNAGYVLPMFYHLNEGKGQQEFESELIERFGSLFKLPLLKSERLEATKGTYAKE
ncbi:hypothetical protein MLD38_003526 [Melastoma candidum]|uniref:Uncharacterized protein n=1 Tax=Melastoma candidum TaxID=119954 RepID=A0ACB9S343_9MYRT|nr:hypothetical protein MLD38_003526 [Melastoma candidum]